MSSEANRRSSRVYRSKHPDRVRDNILRGRRRRIGWTEERVAAARDEQNNKCAVCNVPFTKTPNADHEHGDVPKPRGLLCTRCNIFVGMIENNELFIAALAYLKKWSCVQ